MNKFVIVTHQKWCGEVKVSMGAYVARRASRVFVVLLIEISSRKAVPEVPSTYTGPLHESSNHKLGKKGGVHILPEPCTTSQHHDASYHSHCAPSRPVHGRVVHV